jgi:hypothetical protein
VTPVLEQQEEVVGAPRAPARLPIGFGSRARDTEAGRARIAAAIARFVEHCQQTETPWLPCQRGTGGLKAETGEPVVSGLEARG